eukprot:g3170.t1
MARGIIHRFHSRPSLPLVVVSYADRCEKCASGQYTDQAGLAECKGTACPPGRFGPLGSASAGAATCTDCQAGRFSGIAAGAGTCKECPLGKWSPAGAESCAGACRSGTYSSTGAPPCSGKVCPVGQHGPPMSTSAGAATCAACQAGHFSGDAAGAATCAVCPRGKWSAAGAGSCTACESGRISNTSGASSAAPCARCEAGRFAGGAGGSGDTASAATCEECPRGKWSAAGAGECTACENGITAGNASVGAESCTACSAGRYSTMAGTCEWCHPSNADACAAAAADGAIIELPRGTILGDGKGGVASIVNGALHVQEKHGFENWGSTSLTKARWIANLRRDVGRQLACKACEAGKYQPDPGATTCKPCGNDKYQNEGGKTFCHAKVQCVPGEFVTNATALDASRCAKCATGMYSGLSNAPSCTLCAKDTYQNQRGKTFCHTKVQYLRVCIECYPGRFISSSTKRCQPCPRDTYQDLAGQAQCKPCDNGKRCDGEGLASGSTCLEGQACQVLDKTLKLELAEQGMTEEEMAKAQALGSCLYGWHCPDATLAGARRCEPSEIWDGVARCKRCERSNQFAVNNATRPWLAMKLGRDVCVECPETLNEEAECSRGELHFRDGFWHTGLEWQDASAQTVAVHKTAESVVNETVTFFPCKCSGCCIVHETTGSVTCAAGTAGALCGECAAGHFNRADGKCIKCAELSIASDAPWAICLSTVIFALLFICSDARCEWRRLRFLQCRIQGCRRYLVGKSKIVLSFFQILSLSTMVYRVPFPSVFATFLNQLMFLRFDLFQLVPLQCVAPYTFHDVLDLNVAMALVMLLAPCTKLANELRSWASSPVSQAQGSGDGGGRGSARWSEAAIGWCIVFTYVFYPTISSTFFQSFSCEVIVLGTKRSATAQPPARSRWLHRDYAIDCDSDEHQMYERWATAMIVLFAFGVPALLWSLLYQHRRNLLQADAQYLSFLYNDYHAKFWYWEVVECCRKLALTGVALFIGEQGSLIQLSVALMLVASYTVVLMKAQPYALPSDNALAQLVNAGLFVTLFASLLSKVKAAFVSTGRFALGYTEDDLGYLLILVAVVVIAAWSCALVLDVRNFNTRQSFRFEENGHLLTMPVLDGTAKLYHAFISHSQQDGGDQVANIKKELEKYIGTINIFTDVAAGQRERALTEKSQLYTAIERSEVFLVFLTKTFFTRKWCVKEFQEASARGKHIVLVLESDPRHGGMSADGFAAYSTSQRERSKGDAVSKASNLWNQAALGGDAECAALCDWVANHVAVETGLGNKVGGGGALDPRLSVRAFTYAPQGDGGPAIDVPARSYAVIPWYRYAAEKRVALQLIAEAMLAAPRWRLPPQRRRLHLPVPRVRLARPAQRYHVCLSGFNGSSAVLKARLEAFDARVRVFVPDPGQPAAAQQLALCDAVIVLNNRAPGKRGVHELCDNVRYQADVRAALNAGLHVVLVHECGVSFGEVQAALWEQALGVEPCLEACHVRQVFDPIAVYCQPSLMQEGGTSASLFDQSSLWQIVSKVARAQPVPARVGLAGGRCFAKRRGLSREPARSRTARSQAGGGKGSDTQQNPMHGAGGRVEQQTDPRYYSSQEDLNVAL